MAKANTHIIHNRRAELIQRRLEVQRGAILNLKDGDIPAAVRLQKDALELTVEIQKLTLQLFCENTKPADDGIQRVVIRDTAEPVLA